MYLMRIRRAPGLVQNSERAVVAALIIAAAGLFSHALAADNDATSLKEAGIFTVRGVPVDVTAATATAARERALAEGQAEALRRVLTRLTRRTDHPALPTVDADTVAYLVQGFEVANEKTSAVRYLADLTVRFKPAEIRNLLRRSGLPFAETASRPLVVLPVLRTADGLVLWDATNRWRAAWAALPLRNGLVPMIVPLGDLADITDIDAAQALLGDPAALAAISNRYGAGGALVASASLSTREDSLTALDVAATRPNDSSAAPLLLSFSAGSVDEVNELMQLAAQETVQGIEEAWLENHLLRFDNLQSMTLAIPVDGIDRWAAVERKLASVAEIARVELRVLRRESAEVRIDYYGEERQLVTALRQRDLELEPPLAEVAVSVGAGIVRPDAGNRDAPALRVLRPLGS